MLKEVITVTVKSHFDTRLSSKKQNILNMTSKTIGGAKQILYFIN